MRPVRLVLMGLSAIAFLFAAEPSDAQFGKLKDKLKKTGDKIETNLKKVQEAAKDTSASKQATPGAQPTDSTSAAPAGDDFQLYTKYDFVPGQKVLYYDDLANEEDGEFPSRWNLKDGVFEIARVNNEPWIMSSTRGKIAPKLNLNQFPERYTIEFEYLNRTGDYTLTHSFDLIWTSGDRKVAHLHLINNKNAFFFMQDEKGVEQQVSNKPLPETFKKGLHTIRAMVTMNSIKCYVDNERLVNAPKPEHFKPTDLALEFYATDPDLKKDKMFFRNFRFAEGGKEMKQQMVDSGRVVLHGIYFDVNSDKIKGESYKTLADIAQMLTDDAALKLTIEGHTDSDGEDAFNMDLSQRRAESVRTYLIGTYKLDAARLQAKGYGETKPVDNNTTPEGKANNRRVELVKI